MKSMHKRHGSPNLLLNGYTILQNKHTLSFFISNTGKMRLVWSFTIFRVVAYFRCLEKIVNIVVASKKKPEKIGKNRTI